MKFVVQCAFLLILAVSGVAAHAQTPFFPGQEVTPQAREEEAVEKKVVPEPQAVQGDTPAAEEGAVQDPAAQPTEAENATIADPYRMYLMASGPAVFSTSNAFNVYPFFIEEKGPVRLSVGIETGSALAQENSQMIVYLNDAEVSREALGPELNARAQITLPQALIRVGRNEIKVRVQQHNGMCAVGENVWARLNPEFTYVEFSEGLRSPGWINPGPDAFIDVAYVRSGQNETASAASLITAAMHVSARLPRVRIRPDVHDAFEDVPEDADLVVLTDGTQHDHPRAKVINMQQINELAENPMVGVVDVMGGDQKSLRDFGLVAEGWEEDRYARSIFLRIPDTFLSMSSGNMRFVLNGRAEQRLSSQSSLTVMVNNQISSSVSMPPRWGERSSLTFDVPMRHMRPGLNKMELVIETPGSVCGTSSGGKLALFGDSTITFPSFGEAQRLSIFSLLSQTADPIYVVSDKMGKDEVELVASIMSRMVRSVDHIPSIEIVPPSDWLDSRNALILSTGVEGTRGYEAVFGMGLDQIDRWRTSLRQRLMDIADISNEDEIAATEGGTDTWAREAYARRNVPLIGGRGGFFDTIKDKAKALIDTDAIDLQGGDISFLVARRAPENGIHVLFSVADMSQTEEISGFISQSGPFLWDGRSAHIEADGDIRPYRDLGMPIVSNKNPSNLRLVFADIMSTQYYVYFMLIVFIAICLSISTNALLKKKDT